MNAQQFLDLVVKPALWNLPSNMQGHVAECLLMGTAAQESHLCEYIAQLNGPALGPFQIEPATHKDLYVNYLAFRPELRRALLHQAHRDCSDPNLERVDYDRLHDELITNLIYSAMVARLVYYRKPDPLPGSTDPHSLGEFWKEHYNTWQGKGTVDEFVSNYKRLVNGS